MQEYPFPPLDEHLQPTDSFIAINEGGSRADQKDTYAILSADSMQAGLAGLSLSDLPQVNAVLKKAGIHEPITQEGLTRLQEILKAWGDSVMIVTDGYGSETDGPDASQITTLAMVWQLANGGQPGPLSWKIEHGIQQAHKGVLHWKRSITLPGQKEPTTGAVTGAIVLQSNKTTVITVGDVSPVIVSPSSGAVTFPVLPDSQLSRDYVAGAVSFLAIQDPKYIGSYTVLHSAGDGEGNLPVTTHTLDALEPGQYIFLCSDGVIEDASVTDTVYANSQVRDLPERTPEERKAKLQSYYQHLLEARIKKTARKSETPLTLPQVAESLTQHKGAYRGDNYTLTGASGKAVGKPAQAYARPAEIQRPPEAAAQPLPAPERALPAAAVELKKLKRNKPYPPLYVALRNSTDSHLILPGVPAQINSLADQLLVRLEAYHNPNLSSIDQFPKPDLEFALLLEGLRRGNPETVINFTDIQPNQVDQYLKLLQSCTPDTIRTQALTVGSLAGHMLPRGSFAPLTDNHHKTILQLLTNNTEFTSDPDTIRAFFSGMWRSMFTEAIQNELLSPTMAESLHLSHYRGFMQSLGPLILQNRDIYTQANRQTFEEYKRRYGGKFMTHFGKVLLSKDPNVTAIFNLASSR